MTEIEAIRHLEDMQRLYLGNEKFTVDIEAIGIAIKALEQQPAEDAISRESVIEWLKDKDIIKTKNQEENARRELAELPSVTPTRPKGKWVYKMQVMNDPYTYQCSVCKGWERDKTKYCPECGAKMQEAEE